MAAAGRTQSLSCLWQPCHSRAAVSSGDIEETFRVSKTLKVFFVDARADVFPIQRARDIASFQPIDDEHFVQTAGVSQRLQHTSLDGESCSQGQQLIDFDLGMNLAAGLFSGRRCKALARL